MTDKMNVNAAVFVPSINKGSSSTKSSSSTSATSNSNANNNASLVSARTFHPSQVTTHDKGHYQKSGRGNWKGPVDPRSSRKLNSPQQRGFKSNQHRSSAISSSNHDYENIANLLHAENNGQEDTNSEEVSDTFFELTPNKRGQISLNHLLNFSFPPRQRPTSEFRQPARRKANYVPYNKERFVNANFRFLVKPIRDFTVYLADPDLVIEWSDINQVLITTTNPPSCPICLQSPTAARVTKCGHTFCFPCIMHYLSLSEEKRSWRKCPICWESVYAKDLKSVRFWEVASIKTPGEESDSNNNLFSDDSITNEQKLEFRLMERRMETMLALPKSAYWPSHHENINVPSHFTPDAMAFAKFMITTPEYMIAELQRDLEEVNRLLKDSGSWNEEAEIPFLEMAASNIKDEIQTVITEGIENDIGEKQMKERKEIAKVQSSEQAATMKEKKVELVVVEEAPEFFEHTHSITSEGDISKSLLNPTSGLQSRSKNLETSYFFYQSHDGQHIYLHPLDIRILKHEFGSYAKFPLMFTAPVIAVSESTFTADLRKRFKYLSHLPLSCDITFVELDLSNVVSEMTMQAFSNELKTRMAKRQEKLKKEEKAWKEAEERELRQLESTMGGERGRLARLERELLMREDPFFQISTSPPSPAIDDTTEHSNFRSEMELNEHDQPISEGSVGSSDDHHIAGSSPTLSQSMSSLFKKTAWGTSTVSFANVAANKQKPSERSGKWLAYDDDFDDNYDDWGETREIVNKKGKKKLVLMSTGGRRGG